MYGIMWDLEELDNTCGITEYDKIGEIMLYL